MVFSSILVFLSNLILFSSLTGACQNHHDVGSYSQAAIIAANNHARSVRLRRSSSLSRAIALDNVRIFDGHKILRPSTVFISNGLIAEGGDCRNATRIDGGGLVLLPGLIDSHCHPSTVTHLESLAKHGVTTGLMMACFKEEMCTSLANHPGLPDIRFASAPASSPGSTHGNITSIIDPTLVISNVSGIPEWMRRQLSSTSFQPNYIKIIASKPGFDQSSLNALVIEAKKQGKISVMHASAQEAFTQAIQSKTKHIHHVPLDLPLPANSPFLRQMKQGGQIATPTLTMMRSIALAGRGTDNYTAALLTTRALHRSGIPILAGTDANEASVVPARVPFGKSMGDELDNLVEAGLSHLEALRAATVLPALHFGLKDRGAIRPGMRADLVLVEGNPLEDIKAVRNVKRVYVGGVEVPGL